MTEELLTKGKDLKQRIDMLENNILLWEHAERIDSIDLKFPDNKAELNGKGKYINADFIGFELLRKQTLDHLCKVLHDAKEQFKNL